MNNIKVITSGALTTVQDIGRYGYQKFGIPVAGVMDEYSYKIANYLVGNDENEAVLEMTFIGSNLEFLEDMVIAITGANLKPQINKKDISMWQSIQVKKGDVLSFAGVKEGIRTYVAFGGKINVPVVNGSKSTTIKSKLGGYNGRKLQKDDMLEIIISKNATKNKKLDEKYIPKFNKEEKIRVVLGPQDDYFTEYGISTFLSKEGYSITAESDRMGVRLDGKAIEHKKTADIISDGAVIGSIQVPANGMPIILMADRQTTGGYTKIGTVIKEDICKIAQMGTNFKLFFEELTIQESQEEYKKYHKKFEEIKKQITSSNSEKDTKQDENKKEVTKQTNLVYEKFNQNSQTTFTTNINGKMVDVSISLV
jgi:urea carboxylase